MKISKLKAEVSTVPVTLCQMTERDKLELIKKFQRMEGCLDCYGSPYVRVCNQFECLWREECQDTSQQGEEHAQNT